MAMSFCGERGGGGYGQNQRSKDLYACHCEFTLFAQIARCAKAAEALRSSSCLTASCASEPRVIEKLQQSSRVGLCARELAPISDQNGAEESSTIVVNAAGRLELSLSGREKRMAGP